LKEKKKKKTAEECPFCPKPSTENHNFQRDKKEQERTRLNTPSSPKLLPPLHKSQSGKTAPRAML